MPVTLPRTPEDSMEDTETEGVRIMLQELGAALDAHRLPRVHNCGIVSLGGAPSPHLTSETKDERQRKARSAAGSRQRPTRRERPADRSRPVGPSARIGGGLRAAYEAQLVDVREAYPTLQAFPAAEGMWLLARSTILPGLQRDATFLVAVPFGTGLLPKAWAFWNLASGTRWIGPRHTNFGDGSVCAFAIADRIWFDGQSIATLLDVYTVWALRHLHLELLGRWPGRQYALTDPDDSRVAAYYRRAEFQDDELCSCESHLRYAACCKTDDYSHNFMQAASAAIRLVVSFSRRPPPEILAYMEGRSELPPLPRFTAADSYQPALSRRLAAP